MKIKKEMKGHGMCGINTNVGFPAYKKWFNSIILNII